MKLGKTKVASLALAVMLACALVLTGCGGGTSGSTGGGDASTSADSGAPAPSGDKTEILVGYVAPFTGPLAVFTVATEWVEKQCIDFMNADGGYEIEGYDEKLPIRIIYRDSESDATKASEVADQLVMNDGVDILVGAWTPDTTIPVSQVCERRGVPGLMSNSPQGAWLKGGPADGYEWASGIFFEFDLALDDYIAAWDSLDTNKKVGYVFDNEVDGILNSTMLDEKLPAAGYEKFDPGRFPKATNDYTNLISELRNAECDIVVGNMQTPDFAVFWKQISQSGWMPKILLVGKAYHFDTDVMNLDGDGANLMTEIHWDRTFPFTSSLTGQTCEEIAALWEEENDSQYPQTCMGYDYTCLEVIDAALREAKSLDPAKVRDAIRAVELDSVYGEVSFNENNAMIVPCITVQWVADESGTYDYVARVVGADHYPLIPVKDTLPMPGSE